MTTTTRQTRHRMIWRAVKVTAVIAGTWFLAIPQLPIAWAALGALASINPAVLLAGAACSVAALLAYAQLMRTLLEDGRRPGLWHTMGIITTSLGINRVMPAGAAAGGVMTFRLLERAGIRRPRAAFTMAVQSIGSALVLNALLWTALIIALPVYGYASSYLLAVGAGALVFTLVAFVTDALYRRRQWLWQTVDRLARALPRVDPTAANHHLDDQSERIRTLFDRPATLRRAAAWATANWLLDATALWVFLAAFGVTMSPIAVLVAFALANVVAFLPITPGGLGVVELALTATLVGFGAAAIPAALGVAAYRVFNYWVPIPVSAVAYLAVRGISIPDAEVDLGATQVPAFAAPRIAAIGPAARGRRKIDHIVGTAAPTRARLTRRTMIAIAAGFALVLGAGGIATTG